MSRYQYIYIHLSSQRTERVKVSRWYTLVSMYHPNLDRIMKHSYRRWKPRLVVVTLDYMHVRRNGPQIFVCFFVAYVACAQDLLDFAWNQKLLEFRGKVMYTMRDMQVADDENEHHDAQASLSSLLTMPNGEGHRYLRMLVSSF